jgi:alpha-glucosidase
VTRAGATSWPVYLPAGGWYDYWTQQRYDGPRGVAVEAPLDRLPLFVRAGAMLPLGPLMQWSDERPMDEITLLLYPEGHSRFDLYEDDGRTNGYRAGAYAVTSIECDGNAQSAMVRIGQPSGDAAVIPAGRSYTLQVHSSPPRRVALEGTGELPRVAPGASGDPGWWHDGHFTYIRTSQAVCSVNIEL